MVSVADYTGLKPAWCPGCGNFGVLKALNRALVELKIEPHQILLVSGIGQAGKLPHYTKGNVFNSLHGRPLSPATGAKIVNPDMVVIAVSGDGDAYGEGGNHFIHSARRNHDLTYLVHDNQVYGLTKGQASPTSETGYITKTTVYGSPAPINPLVLAIAAGAGFVARSFAGDIDHLSGVIQQGIQHKGFSLIDILQPCVTFNHRNTYDWYRQRIYKLDAGYDTGNKAAALQKAAEWGDKIPIGVIYRENKGTFEDLLGIKNTLVRQQIEPEKIKAVLEEFI